MKALADKIVPGLGSEPAVRQIRACGAVERAGNTEELTRHIGAERIKWKKVIEAAKLKPK